MLLVATTAIAVGVSPAGASPASVHVESQAGSVEVSVEGRPAFSYASAPRVEGEAGPEFTRGGFLHPIRTPRGLLVSDAFSPVHAHQTGVFTAWTSTRFDGHEVDFWNIGKRLGRVEPVAVERTWSGAESGGFVARHRHVDLAGGEPRPVLDEWWHVTVPRSRQDEPLVVDLDIRQACAGDLPLHLLEYRYGGFAFRGHARWLDPAAVELLTSEALRDRIEINGTRVRWCAMSGPLEDGSDGAVGGLAILSHPSNFRAPQPVRVHPTMPMMCFAPVQLGAFDIRPGVPLVMRYRLVVFDGPADAARLESLWSEFAGTQAER